MVIVVTMSVMTAMTVAAAAVAMDGCGSGGRSAAMIAVMLTPR